MIKNHLRLFVVVLFFLSFVLIGLSIGKTPHQVPPATVVLSPTERVPAITQVELSRGWYWGSIDQKKPETPYGWIFSEAGRSSCWHVPTISCQ